MPSPNTSNLYLLLITILLISCAESEQELSVTADATEPVVGEAHFISGYEPFTQDSLVNVIVEIPAGTDAKWEVELDSGNIAWEYRDGKPRVVNYVGYPGNYGMVPQTKIGKGDAVDILVLGAPIERGSVVETKLIGVLEMIDGGEPDSKLIAVPLDSHFTRVNSIQELDENFPGVSTIISLWFDHYKGPVNDVEVIGMNGTDRAWEILQASMDEYSEQSVQ